MKVNMTLEISDAQRRALNAKNHKKGLATRDDVREEFRAVWVAHLDDCIAEETP